MIISDYLALDGLGLAAAIAARHVSAAEVLETAISAIELFNPSVNAVVFKAYDEARAQVQGELSGPFAGVPVLFKDLGLEVRGWPRTSGSRYAVGVIDQADSGLVGRYRAAGVVPVGHSASSEFGIIGTTETAAYGPTRNPWDLSCIAGGSSGGAAAAVAAGMVPIAHASDGLGSIRIPAACCGLVGLKPTRDRVPNLPNTTDYAIGFVCDHVVTRTVRDSAAMLDASDPPEAGSPYALPPKTHPYLDDVSRARGRLRIRWSSRTVVGAPVDQAVQSALEGTAKVLRQLGHDVRDQALEIDELALGRARLPISAANFAAVFSALSRQVGREPTDDELEPLTLEALKISRFVTGEMVVAGMQDLRGLTRAIVKQFDDFDVFLSPVMTAPPPPIGSIDAVERHPALANAAQLALYPFALTFNFTGQPSISLPLGWTTSGLPIGMMFTARYADEATLFSLAGQLEKEIPWSQRRPPIWDSIKSL